jgi:hypothetical protein
MGRERRGAFVSGFFFRAWLYYNNHRGGRFVLYCAAEEGNTQMELLKAIGLVPDEKEEKGENAADSESVQETDEGRSGSSGSVPTNQRAATTTPTIMADGGPPLVDLGSDTSAARRRRSTSTAEVVPPPPPFFSIRAHLPGLNIYFYFILFYFLELRE